MINRAKQNALNYIMYMIVGSYFDKAIPRSPLKEKQLFLYYKDMKSTEQVDLEARCIRYVERFCRAVPEEFWRQTVEVSFLGDEGNIIRMQSDKNILYIRVAYQKKNPQFQIKLYTKNCESGYKPGSQFLC